MKKIFLMAVVTCSILFSGEIEDNFIEQKKEDSLVKKEVILKINMDKVQKYGNKVVKNLEEIKKFIEKLETDPDFREKVIKQEGIKALQERVKALTELYKEKRIKKDLYNQYKTKYQNEINKLKGE